MPEKIHDKGYKRILSKKKNFLDLLKNFVKASWVESVKESDLELIDKEFIPQDFREKESDIIYKVRLGEKEAIFYFLIELQSTVDYTIPLRLLVYTVELYKRLFLDASENDREKKGFRLPPVVPCVLYNGESAWTAASRFREYLDGFETFGDHIIDFKYVLLNVNNFTDESLHEIGDLVSSIFLLDKKQDTKRFLQNLKWVLKATEGLVQDEQIELKDWLSDVLTKKAKGENKEVIEEMLKLQKKGDVDEMTYAIERMMDDLETKGMERAVRVIRLQNRGVSTASIANEMNMDEGDVKSIIAMYEK